LESAVDEVADDRAANVMFTERQDEILSRVSAGMANKQIADDLGISAHTVDFHLREIFKRLNVGTRSEAAAVWTTRIRRLRNQPDRAKLSA
jgi:DNA-binding CsgD family transcriptional regulator